MHQFGYHSLTRRRTNFLFVTITYYYNTIHAKFMQHSCVLTGKNKRNANQNVAIGYMGTVGQQSKDSIVRDFRNR
jgi:hypothetical protein